MSTKIVSTKIREAMGWLVNRIKPENTPAPPRHSGFTPPCPSRPFQPEPLVLEAQENFGRASIALSKKNDKLFQKAIPDSALKSIFDESKLTLKYDSFHGKEYCYVADNGGDILCCLRGSKIGSEIQFEGINFAKAGGMDSSRFEFRAALSKLPEEKQEKAFKMFGLEPLSKYGEEFLQLKLAKTEKLNELMSSKAHFVPFDPKNKVLSVGMREELVVPVEKAGNFVGTFGLGPCIGVGVVSKVNGKPAKIGVAHIDIFTDLKSLGSFMHRSTEGATEVEIKMVSSQNHVEKAREILDKILLPSDVNSKIKVTADLSASTSFAINPKTGEISKDIPFRSFIQGQEMFPASLLMPSGLNRSIHYKSFS